MNKKLFSRFFTSIGILLILAGCGSSSGGSGGIEYSTSWIGARAVELSLKNNSKGAQNVGIIIRDANEDVPIYSDAKDKDGFLQRTIEAKNTTKIFTAMHYGTLFANTDEDTKITDVLSPNTAYQAYIFKDSDGSLLKTIAFTTKNPPTGDEIEADGADYLKSFPGGDIPHNDPKNISGHYIAHAKAGEPFLIPIIFNANLNSGAGLISGIRIFHPNSENSEQVMECNLPNTECANTGIMDGYSNTILPKIEKTDNTDIYYTQYILKIDNLTSSLDKGEWTIQDGAVGRPAHFSITTK